MRGKKITGSVGITRRSDGFFYIVCRCEDSSTEFAEFKMTGKQFAEAVTGLHGQDVELTVRQLHRVGKTMEHKIVEVWSMEGYDHSTIEAIPRHIWTDMVEEIEEDEWIVEKNNWGNHHQRIRVDDGTKRVGYHCIARRWV